MKIGLDIGVNMMPDKLLSRMLAVVTLVVTSLPGLSQTSPENHALVVSGQPGQVPVVQINGRSYVDVEALARLMNGSIGFKGNQITLTLPGSSASASAAAPPTNQASSAFSKDFLNAGIEAMSVIREWRSALINAIQSGYPLSSDFAAGYRSQGTKNLRLAFVAVSTDADRSAYQLLSNELDTMQKFNDKILAARKNMQDISPDSLRDDPLNQQILGCARSLVAMASSGQFQDDGSCHPTN
jgi:hypothetical protein